MSFYLSKEMLDGVPISVFSASKSEPELMKCSVEHGAESTSNAT